MTTTHAAPDEDFGLAGHLAAIALLHGQALAQMEVLAQPWQISGPRVAEFQPVTQELLVAGQPPVPDAVAVAAAA